MADSVDPDPPPPPPPTEVAVTQPVTPIPSAIPPNAPPPRQSCWDKRSKLEKGLVFLLVIVLIICLAIVAVFLIYYFFSTPPEGQCLTNTCMRAATALEAKMDKSVDPCNNFYEYACGGWLKKTSLASDQAEVNFATIMNDDVSNKIKDLLENKRPDDPMYKKQATTVYAACMNLEVINERGNEPFLKVLRSIGKFPSLDETWNETDFDLDVLLLNLKKELDLNPLISFFVQQDAKSALTNRISVGDGALSLGDTAYRNGRNDPRLAKLEDFLASQLVLLGANYTTAYADVRNIIDLEIKISKLKRSDREKSDIERLYNPMNVNSMNIKYPWLNWQRLFQGMVGTSSAAYIGLDELIIVSEPLFLEKLGSLLNNTSKRVLANYLMSSTLRHYTHALGKSYSDIFDKFRKEMSGVSPKPRWDTCAWETSAVFPETVSRLYIDQYFDSKSRDYLKSMIEDLKVAFTELLEQNEWMSEETKRKTENKLKKMQAKIGYPDYIMDDARLNSRYASIPYKETEYFETLIAHARFVVIDNFKQLRDSPNKDLWLLPPIKVGAFYRPPANEIIFPAAFLQKPVYSPDFSSSVNYGAIGTIVGHEITHGFDHRGSQYDVNGEFKNWWKKEDRANFNSRAQCFVDQYGCFKWEGLSLDGDRTLGENIADNGGLKQSYRAYRNYVKRRGSEELKLPGLELNHDQVFFLSFAQIWCEKVRDEMKSQKVEVLQHTPNPYRVIGTLQNSKEFAFAYGCKPETRMNPLRKCVLW
ncbi:hypothetical protein Btru_066992 [Bulinus truncatus]|nr:hypothetical protein Btru_066992 [Bulinus truncatus]